ncbi:hypothetical protein BGZ60DRAFT_63391 [Tricladium varicosporioides]|nr:hypothetical protein BGZ60DRAFT_63391 [Hymenoscyphus varicosporioides]
MNSTTPPSQATRVPQLIATNSILLSLATLAVGLRFYTRTKITRYIGADDWWMLATWIFALGQFALWTVYDHIGNAQHVWNLKPQNITQFYLILWLVQMAYPLGIGLIKMSILALYLRLFPSDTFRLIIQCAMGFIGAMTTAVVFAVMFSCNPVDSNWKIPPWEKPNCINRTNLVFAISGLAFVTDIAVLLMPMKYLIRLRVSTRERIQVIAVMGLGGVTCIASIVRFKYMGVVAYGSDPTWDGFYLSFWSSIEFHLGVITSCIPAIKPLYMMWIRNLLERLKGKDSGTGNTSQTPVYLESV